MRSFTLFVVGEVILVGCMNFLFSSLDFLRIFIYQLFLSSYSWVVEFLYYFHGFFLRSFLYAFFLCPYNWILGSSWKGPMTQELCIHLPSVLSSVCLSKHFLVIGSLVFAKFWHGDRNPYLVVHNRAIFFRNFFCPQNGPKIGLF